MKLKKEMLHRVHLLRVPTRPNEQIFADLWGPHKDKDGNSKWVCIITDGLTKLVYL